MQKNITITLILAVLSTSIGVANAANPGKRSAQPTSARNASPLGSASKNPRDKRVMLRAGKAKSKAESRVSPGDLLSPFGSTDHPLKLEADLHAADNMEDPSERRQAVAKAKRAIATYNAKHPNQPWEASIRSANIRRLVETRHEEGEAAKPLSDLVQTIAISAVGAVLGISLGHEVVDIGQADSVFGNIALVVGYGNLGAVSYMVREYKQAKARLTSAVDDGYRAFKRFASFEALVGRTNRTE